MLRVGQALARARGKSYVIACLGLALCGSALAQAVNITPPNLSAGLAGALKGSASATLTGASPRAADHHRRRFAAGGVFLR